MKRRTLVLGTKTDFLGPSEAESGPYENKQSAAGAIFIPRYWTQGAGPCREIGVKAPGSTLRGEKENGPSTILGETGRGVHSSSLAVPACPAASCLACRDAGLLRLGNEEAMRFDLIEDPRSPDHRLEASEQSLLRLAFTQIYVQNLNPPLSFPVLAAIIGPWDNDVCYGASELRSGPSPRKHPAYQHQLSEH